MQPDDDALAYHELQQIFRARVTDSFVRARRSVLFARMAQRDGDEARFHEWVESIRVFRSAAARWRKRAQGAVPMLVCLLWCLVGCAKVSTPPTREFTASFQVEPSSDGSELHWSLQFQTRTEYHTFIETTPEGAERAKVRELIADGMKLHHIVGCSAQEQAVTKLGDDGIAFVGSCVVTVHATPAGGV